MEDNELEYELLMRVCVIVRDREVDEKTLEDILVKEARDRKSGRWQNIGTDEEELQKVDRKVAEIIQLGRGVRGVNGNVVRKI